jgi:serine/threonine protein kinase
MRQGSGSGPWMAPEQVSEPEHRRVQAHDTYAFGCLGYYVSP